MNHQSVKDRSTNSRICHTDRGVDIVCVDVAKNDAHRRMDAEASHDVPHVSMDYCFMGQDEEKCLPILVMKDHRSKMVFSHVVPKKGASIAYCVSQVVRDLEYLGYPKMILKSDQEPAILDLRNAVAKQCKELGMEVLPESSPVAESQSNGVVERAIQEIEGLVRTLKKIRWKRSTKST